MSQAQPLAALQSIGDGGRPHPSAAIDPVTLGCIVVGLLSLAVPLFWNLSTGWPAEGMQGHEAAIYAVSIYLIWRRRDRLAAPGRPAIWTGGGTIALALALYVFGRAYDLRIALISLIVLLAGILLRYRGGSVLRDHWFALLFPLFALPLPIEFVLEVTGPLKTGVSTVATALLSGLGYPIGRAGVVITIGQYQLLVTEACAGLQTMFMLEAMGLLYAALVNHGSALRNAALAVLVVPIAFFANVVRVVVLCLVTFHFGDAVGQGFLHDFSGIVLFLVALVTVALTDGLLGRALDGKHA